jgi:hypothetical protein
MRNKIWGIFVEALLAVNGKLRGKRMSEKKLVETMVFLGQLDKTVDNVTIGEDGEVKVRSLKSIFQECLGMYDQDVQEHGEFNPLTDGRNLFEEAQKHMRMANLCIAMGIEKIREKKLQEPEEERDSIAELYAEMVRDNREINKTGDLRTELFKVIIGSRPEYPETEDRIDLPPTVEEDEQAMSA